MTARDGGEKSQRLFREINERIKELSERLHEGENELLDFMCECRRDSCTESVTLTRVEYENVRAAPRLFVVRPGHESEGERVVTRGDRFLAVEDADAYC